MDSTSKILEAIEDPKVAEILSKYLDLVENSPMSAIRLVRAFEQATAVIEKATKEIPECWQKLDDLLLESELRRQQFTGDLAKFRKETIDETAACAGALTTLKTALAGFDDNSLNRANRVIEVAEKLSKLKRDGTLDLLQKLQ